MNKVSRKVNSADKFAKAMGRALVIFAADLASKGILDLPTLGAASRQIQKQRTQERSPKIEYKPEDFLTPDEAGCFLMQSTKTLANKRHKGNGPRFTKLSNRAIRYRYQDLMDFALSGSRMSTSDIGANEYISAEKTTSQPISPATPKRRKITVTPSSPRKSPNKTCRKKPKHRRKTGKK